MSKINQLIESRFKAVRRDARHRPVIDAVKASVVPGMTSEQVLQVAVQATVDEFKRTGRPLQADAIREQALLDTAAASMEKRFALSDLPSGTDKTEHFMTSAFLSLKVAEAADKMMPRAWAEKLGFGASAALGWGKEVYDKFFATGYSREDLAADFAGARRPYQLAVPGVKS